MHRSRRCHDQVSVEEADRRLAAIPHPDGRRDNIHYQVDQRVGLGILVARLIVLLIPVLVLAEHLLAAAVAANTTSAATGLAAAGRIRQVKLRRLNKRRRLNQQVLHG